MPSTSSRTVVDAVEARLTSFLSGIRAQAGEYGPDGIRFIDAAERTLQGGKRLRARFCHAGWQAVARHADDMAAEPDALWGVCAALEIFQSAALVHDDLIDNSDTRRGRPAAHRALEAGHIAEGWSGDAEAFGRAGAILLGDLLVAWSDDLLEESIAEHPNADAVRREYARMRRDVTIGQFLDIAEESAWSVSPLDEHADRALRVISLKSARYSIEEPLLLGALLAGADAGQQSALRRFGNPVGMAFQLRDDILGVFGDESVTGKPSGDDLREGKRTVLVAFTRERIDGAARDALDALLGDRGLGADVIAGLQRTISESGALDRVEALIAEYATTALRVLDDALLQRDAVERLRDLAGQATRRAS
ncbi:polyprenyl synthetase family protein [Microbacterium sp. NPDC055903]